MFDQRWSIMRNVWTDASGRQHEDVIVIMLLSANVAQKVARSSLAQIQSLSSPNSALSPIAERLFGNAVEVRKHVLGIQRNVRP
jgi:hypothetical protein